MQTYQGPISRTAIPISSGRLPAGATSATYARPAMQAPQQRPLISPVGANVTAQGVGYAVPSVQSSVAGGVGYAVPSVQTSHRGGHGHFTHGAHVQAAQGPNEANPQVRPTLRPQNSFERSAAPAKPIPHVRSAVSGHSLAQAIGTSGIDAVYKDKNHWLGGSLDGIRMVTDKIGDEPGKHIYMIGSDDGDNFWACNGYWLNREKGSFIMDFSPKGGPAGVHATFSKGIITWEDENVWEKMNVPEFFLWPPHAGKKRIGGLFTDPNHYREGTYAGWRTICDESTTAWTGEAIESDFVPICIIGSDDGQAFWSVHGTWDKTTGDVTVDFTPKGGPAGIMGVYDAGELRWHDGNSWLRQDVQVSWNPDICTLEHDVPVFRHLDRVDPTNRAARPNWFKEVKVPHATETHEVLYEPVTKTVFLSQMANSVLVRIPVEKDGFLGDDQDAWQLGETDENGKGVAGLHNLSLSPSRPGCIWVTLQFMNLVMLLDLRTMHIAKMMFTPVLMEAEGKLVGIGGPHCVRECEKTGELYVSLKGEIACCPELPSDHPLAANRKAEQAAGRGCCSPETLKANMALLKEKGFDTAPTNAFAIWRIHPEKYDPKATKDLAKGGKLYVSRKSPPMSQQDFLGNCWVAQDGDKSLLRIDVDARKPPKWIPLPRASKSCLTGPGLARDPAGNIWVALLTGDSEVLRVNPNTNKVTLYKMYTPNWSRKLRFIHMAFRDYSKTLEGRTDDSQDAGLMFLLSSDLLDDDSVNALCICHMDANWETIKSVRTMPLPTQDCACHRVSAITEGFDPEFHSVAITEFASSKVIQMRVNNIVDSEPLKEQITQDQLLDGSPCEIRSYTASGEAGGHCC